MTTGFRGISGQTISMFCSSTSYRNISLVEKYNCNAIRKQSLQILAFLIICFFLLISIYDQTKKKSHRKPIKMYLQLMIQYIRYMNISRNNMKNHIQHSEMYSITRNQPDQNYGSLQHKTERKNSLQNRVCLGELPVNRFDSGSKQNSINLKRQNSIQIKKSNNKSINMNGSRWLDNQKQMMEFILNLKSKKSDTKSTQGKKNCEGFQIAQVGVDKEQLLCNRMLNIKKIEKHEKEAINYFYEKDYEKCFAELSKAENLMKKEKIDSQQHQLYINYLYAEFLYKLQDHQKWKNYLIRANFFVNRLSSNQTASMKEYILSIKGLEVCLSLQEQQYQKALRQADQIKSQGKLSSKIRRRVVNAEIAALRKLCRFKQALELIDRQCSALQQDPELNEDKKQLQFSKLFQLKIEITVEFVSNQKAIELIESAIGFKEVSNGEKSNFSYYNSKIYSMFADLLKKDETQKIKLIFFYEKWAEFETCKKQKLKVQLELFKTFYELGIYERALQLFDSISSQNVVYLGPEYLFMFANIKHFNGEISEAVSIATKIVDICQDDEAKGLYLFKILEFNLQEQSEQLRAQREIMLQNFLKSVENGCCTIIIDLYIEYLKARGEGDRSKKFSSFLKKAGKSNMNYILQANTNRRKSIKQ